VPAAVSFEKVSKRFHVRGRQLSIRDETVRALRGLVSRREPGGRYVDALQDVTLEVAEGESFALIGANGAGKTTALKLASRITYPTSGRVRVRGRVGALIEVGHGMHPELTGRENVDLYGRILGLSKRDVRRRFDQIVEFADIGPALEQPVKQFSSGMQLRLGFALASHLDPDVLLVDEAIAVGDAGFQYRCVERISDLVREGRTLVFVSHNMSAIEALCDRAVLLRDGSVAHDGNAREVIHEYLRGVEAELLEEDASRSSSRAAGVQIVRATLHDGSGVQVDDVHSGGPLTVRLHVRADSPLRRPIFEVGLADGRIGPLVLASMLIDGASPEVVTGEGHVDCTFHDLPLMPRVYELWAGIRGEVGYGDIVDWKRLRLFRVTGEVEHAGLAAVSETRTNAPVRLPYEWSFHLDDESSGAQRSSNS